MTKPSFQFILTFMRKLLIYAVFAFYLTPALTYGQNVQIFNGDDMDFGTWSPGDGDQTSDQYICVFKDSGDTFWDVNAIGDGAGGAFELKNVSGTLPVLRVQINIRQLTAAVTSTNLPNADNTGFPDCNEFGGDNQRLRVQLSGATLGATAPGTYDGTLTLTATP